MSVEHLPIAFWTVQGKRLTAKVLSSGVVRGELRAVHDDGSVTVQWSDTLRDQFWASAVVCFIDHGETIHQAKVISQTGHRLQIDAPLRVVPRLPLVVELNAGLESPVLAAHLLLNIPIRDPLPALDVRLGTTRGTNALLTRRGVKVGLIVTKGFGDCLRIGEQNRPDLFALEIEKPIPLTRACAGDR